MESIPDLLESLRRSPAIAAGLVKSIPADRMNLRRGQDFWTIAEHVSHLAQVQPMLLGRIERFIAEDHPEFVPFIPNDHDERTEVQLDAPTALEQFSTYRGRQVALLRGVDEAAWNKTATHPEYEQYSLSILGRHILLHDFWHMYRIEELWLLKDAYLK
ncbi:MAG: DinB family protein [Syntrophobacteraceae bacterium]